MKRLNRLTLKYIGRNKLRTAMTIFAISLSSFVIFSIFTIGLSIDYSKKRTEYEATGPYDAVYVLNVDSALKLNSIMQGTEEGESKTSDYPKLSKTVFMSGGAVSAYVSDYSYFGKNFLIEGEYPKTPDEVIISEDRAEHPDKYLVSGTDVECLKVGDSIEFKEEVIVGMSLDTFNEKMEQLHLDIERRAYDKYKDDPKYKDIFERLDREHPDLSGLIGGVIPYADDSDSHLIEDFWEQHCKTITVTRRIVGIYDDAKASKIYRRFETIGIDHREYSSLGYVDINTLNESLTIDDILTDIYRSEYGSEEKVFTWYDSDKREVFSNTVIAEVTFEDKDDLEGQAALLGELLGTDAIMNDKAVAAFNPKDAIASYDTLTRTAVMMVIAAVFAGIIMVIVRNAFNISVNERERDYGMFRIIGLTRKQIIKIILLEALIVGVIGILVGIIFGIFFDKEIFSYLNGHDLGNEMLHTILSGVGKLYFRFSWAALGYTVVYMAIIVGYSMVSPVEKLYRLSPITVLQSKGEIDVKQAQKEQRHKSSRRKRIKSYPVWYGFKNMRVRSNRLMLLIISMGICISLAFAVGCSLSTIISTEYNNQNTPSIVVVARRSAGDNRLSKEDVNRILNDISGKKGFGRAGVFSKKVLYPKCDTETGEYLMLDGPLNIYGMSDEYYKLVEELYGGADLSQEKDTINVMLIAGSGSSGREKLPETGDTVVIAGVKLHISGIINGAAYEALTNKRFPADQRFYPIDQEYYMLFDLDRNEGDFTDKLIEDDEAFMTDSISEYSLYIHTDLEQDDGSIQRYLSDNDYLYSDRSFNYRKMRFAKQLINIAIMVILLIITINLINIRSSEIYQRRKEFSLLRNIGFSKKDIRKSVISEGICVSIYSVIFGMITGLAVAYAITKEVYKGSGISGRFDDSFMEARFSIDWSSLLAAGLVTFGINAIVGAIMLKLLKNEK